MTFEGVSAIMLKANDNSEAVIVEGSKFRVKQPNTHINLCEGVVKEFLGEKEGLRYYAADVTLTFNPSNTRTVTGEVAVGQSGEFYVASRPEGRMANCSEQVEWVS